jgi:hypothetical protein
MRALDMADILAPFFHGFLFHSAIVAAATAMSINNAVLFCSNRGQESPSDVPARLLCRAPERGALAARAFTGWLPA